MGHFIRYFLVDAAVLLTAVLLARPSYAAVTCQPSDGSCYSPSTTATCPDDYRCTCSSNTTTSCTPVGSSSSESGHDAGIAMLVIGCVLCFACLPCMIVYCILVTCCSLVTSPMMGMGGMIVACICFPCSIIALLIVLGVIFLVLN